MEAFSSNRLDCRDKWRFQNVYKFPFSCSPSCHPFWRNFSIVIWSREYFRSAVNFKLCTCPRQFSFTYRCTFLFNNIRIRDIQINVSLIWKYVTRKDTFAILDANLRPLNWKTIRKTTWNLSVLEFLVLKKLFATYKKWQDTQEPSCKCHGCKFNSGCKFKILRVKKVPNDWLLLWNAWM